MSSNPTEQTETTSSTGAESDKSGSGRAAETVLAPGGVLDQGRYRLLSWVGADTRCNAQLWRARDGVLGREVALTILVGDRSDSEVAASARKTLERAMHASTFNHVGVARVLDVVTQSADDPHNILGIIIAEWTQGSDLLDLVADGPLPPGTVARLLQPLAGAVEAAHHAGLILGVDHPQRIRVSPDGEVRMAFPGPLPDSAAGDDVRGLGACLYLLLTGRWALEGGPDGLPKAPTGPDGAVVAPRTLNPTIPLELSTVAVRSLGTAEDPGGSSGVRTGAAVLRVLEQCAALEHDTSVMQPLGHGETRTPTASGNDLWQREDPKPDKERRRKLTLATTVLTIVTLVVLGWIGSKALGVFSPSSDNGPSVVVDPDADPGKQATPPPGAPVSPAGIRVYAPDSKSADHQDDVRKAIDGDPGTHWTTDTYKQQFGSGFRAGLGLSVQLPQKAKLSQVVVNSTSPGTQVEIRSANDPTPPQLSSAKVLGHSTLKTGQNTINLKSGQPTQNVIVWIKKLGNSNGGYASKINEVQVIGAK